MKKKAKECLQDISSARIEAGLLSLPVASRVNLLTAIIVISILMFTFFLQVLKSQELQYYKLAEQVKSMNVQILKALIEEKKIGSTNSTGDSVFLYLDNAEAFLEKIDPDLLGDKSSYILQISNLVELFRSSVQQLIRQNSLLLDKKQMLAKLFSENQKISRQLEEYGKIISNRSESIIILSKSLRQEKNRTVSIILFSGCMFFFLAVLAGGRILSNEIQKRMALLKQSENNLEIMLNSIGDAVIATDLEGLITRMNPMAETLTAWQESQAKGRPLTDVFYIINAQTRQITENPVKKVISTGKIIGLANDTKLIAKDSRELQIADSAAPIKNESGDITGVILVFRDVTKEYEMRKAQRESEECYQNLFASSNNAIIIASREGEIIESNPAASALLDYSVEEFKKIKMTRIYANPDKREEFKKEIEKTGEVKDYEIELVSKNGAALSCRLNATLKYKKNGELLGYQGILRDETNQKRLELQLQQSQKMEAIGTLAGGIAHDFNNILSPILGHTEILLADTPENSLSRNSLNEILAASLRAKDLVKQILTFSRQESSELSLIKIQAVIIEALKLIRATIPANINIKKDLQAECGAVKANPTQIHQIIMNLITNACHSMGTRSGELRISLKEVQLGEKDLINPDMTSGIYARLIIADNGAGIDKDIIGKIFDPFFTTKDKAKGTGMGLSVVHGIVKRMNGAILVDSEPGKGTEFKLYFPIEDIDPEIQSTHKEEFFQTGAEHILLVDDEESIITMEVQMLTRLGYQVTSCTSSKKALEIFCSNPDQFDLVITDMAMPELPGDKFAGELIRIRPDMPVLLCTGFSDTMSEEIAKSLGIRGFLMKPTVMKELALKIREVLEEA